MAAATYSEDLQAAAVIANLMVLNAPNVSPALTAALQTRKPSEILSDPSLKTVVVRIYNAWRKLEAQREIRIRALCAAGMSEQEAQNSFNLAVSQASIAAALKGGRR